jgi:hypothetical protein
MAATPFSRSCNHTWVSQVHNDFEERTEIVCMYCLATLDWLPDSMAASNPESLVRWRAGMVDRYGTIS